jgi:hypothetical protein
LIGLSITVVDFFGRDVARLRQQAPTILIRNFGNFLFCSPAGQRRLVAALLAHVRGYARGDEAGFGGFDSCCLLRWKELTPIIRFSPIVRILSNS